MITLAKLSPIRTFLGAMPCRCFAYLTILLCSAIPLASQGLPTAAISIKPFPARSTAGLSASWSSWEARSAAGSGFVFRLHIPPKLPAWQTGQAGNPDSANPDAANPPALIVFLDGSGSNGRDNSRQMQYPIFNALFTGETPLNAIVLVPQCPIADSWDSLEWIGPQAPRAGGNSAPQLELLLAVCRTLQEQYGIPVARRLIWGFSNGAFGVLDCLLHRPEAFGSYASLGGGSDPALLAARLDSQKLWLFHGGRDKNVPVWHSQRLAAALTAVGKDCQLVIFPDADHPVMDSVCTHPGFLAFLRELATF